MKLVRTCHHTDYDPDEPAYTGGFSADVDLLPHPIVDVDWSDLGLVWVTYLMP